MREVGCDVTRGDDDNRFVVITYPRSLTEDKAVSFEATKNNGVTIFCRRSAIAIIIVGKFWVGGGRTREVTIMFNSKLIIRSH